MIGLNKIGLNQVQLNRLRLNAPFPAYGKMAGGDGSGDGFPVLPGDVTRWHFGGLTNEMMAAMDDPRIEDADGKGRFLSFKNFAWKGMSGVGGVSTYYDKYEFTPDKYYMVAVSSGTQHAQFTFKVTGLVDGNTLSLADTSSPSNVYGKWTQDGIYTVDIDVINTDRSLYFYNGVSATRGEFTIEILPLYPGALIFDGVDDYGTCDNFPIPTKEKGYTVVALRQWITRGEIAQGLVSNVKDWFNDGAFLLEYRNVNANYFNSPMSFGTIGSEKDLPHILTYQTSKSYNGVSIITGNFTGTDVLYVGKLATRNVGICINAAIWELVFLDHDATEEELTKIKDYFVKTYPWLFPDQAWTVVGKTNEDEDRATIANITGNGNDLVLSNFGFAEGSGYGLYAQNYISYAITNRAVYTKTNSSIHVTKSITAGVNFTESARDVTIPSYRIKVTGIQSGQEMIYRGSNNTFLTNIPSDGIYVLPAVENGSNLGFQFVSYTGDCDITIEQIPEYEGYLVTDGVDDSGRAVGLTISKDFTLVGEWILFSKTSVNAGLSIHPQIHIFNRPEAIQIMFRTAGKTLPVKSLKAICSDGRCYDENWSELKINVGEFTDNKGTLFVASNGTNYAQIAFKNLGIYDNHILSKDDCIKAYNYLQTLKAK